MASNIKSQFERNERNHGTGTVPELAAEKAALHRKQLHCNWQLQPECEEQIRTSFMAAATLNAGEGE